LLAGKFPQVNKVDLTLNFGRTQTPKNGRSVAHMENGSLGRCKRKIMLWLYTTEAERGFVP